MINRKKAGIVCVVVGLIAMVAAGMAGMTTISRKEAAVESYDPLNYGPGQQAECVISDIKSDADKDSSLKSVSDMVKASVSYTDYGTHMNAIQSQNISCGQTTWEYAGTIQMHLRLCAEIME